MDQEKWYTEVIQVILENKLKAGVNSVVSDFLNADGIPVSGK